MNVIIFLIAKKDTYLKLGGLVQRIERESLSIVNAKNFVSDNDNFITIPCSMSQLLETCNSFTQQTKVNQSDYFESFARVVPLNHSALKSVQHLMMNSPDKVVAFLICYCLSTDWDYFSGFFACRINENGSLMEFFKKHAFNPWSTERYAEMLGLSLRKLNTLFQQNYGVSPKKWLKETRLERAKYLIECTMIPIAEVADHCGFSNHAYFSDSFRKRYQSSPTQWRENILFKSRQNLEILGEY